MFNATWLALLALPYVVAAPASFSMGLDHTQIVDGAGDVQLIAHDHGGAVIGSITLWVESDGTTWVVSDYADGFSVAMIHPDGHLRIDGSLAPTLVASRADSLVASLAGDDSPGGRIECARRVSAMVGSCGTGSLVACPRSALAAACECLPRSQPRWKDLDCSSL
ncbi:MAG: hypothetical protein R6X02_17035 [Enhygromyxa sp.]